MDVMSVVLARARTSKVGSGVLEIEKRSKRTWQEESLCHRLELSELG